MNTTQPPTQRPARRKARARKSVSLNSQMEGPLNVSSRETDGDLTIRNSEGFIVAVVNQYAAKFKDKRDERNARLLATSYTAFDKAGRALGVDAAELAEQIDLPALILASQNLRAMVGNVLTDSQLDIPQLGGARAKCARTIRDALEPLDRVLEYVKPR